MSFWWLYALATLDGALTGIREAGRQTALIRKTPHYVAGLLRGLLVAQVAAACVGGLGWMLWRLSPEPTALLTAWQLAADRLLTVYLPFTAILLTALAVRMIPSVDLRSVLSVAIFGPATLVRSCVAVVGVAWALLAVPRWDVAGLCLLTLVLMLNVAPRVLQRWMRRLIQRPCAGWPTLR